MIRKLYHIQKMKWLEITCQFESPAAKGNVFVLLCQADIEG